MAKSLTSGTLRRSDRLIMAAAVLLALIAAVLVFVAVNNRGGSTTADKATVAGTVAVVTAAEDIPANTKLSAGILQVTTVPADAVLTGNYSTTDTLVGLTTRYPVLKGEQLTNSKVGEAATDNKSLSLVVAPGYRAISFTVNEENIVGGLVLPGDLVDIIAVFDSQNTGIPKSVTLLQNVAVVAVGQEAEKALPAPVGSPAASDGTTGSVGQVPKDVKTQPGASTVTVSVKPDQAQLLALAAQHAKLWLTLRPPGENGNVDLGASDLSGYGVVPQ